MKTYQLQPNKHYGWITGITGVGELVIAAHLVNIYFDEDGLYIRHEDLADIDEWEGRAALVIAVAAPIFVQEFEVTGKPYGIRSMPKRYLKFLNDPNAFSSSERRELKQDVAWWRTEGSYDFDIGDNYWMNSDGTVGSS
ncbi:MAG: hypothetical protein P1V20_32375 [Verrucomicrobiales bacterium]|nr:hypothetical protein [Verrucomicrobiales bacterium]